jgi:hypothetical protein
MNRLIAGLVMLVGALVAFYIGAKYGEAHSTTSNAASATSTGGARALPSGSPGARGNRAGGGAFATPAAAGQVVSVTNGVLTIHDTQTNKDVKVNIGSARITKTTQGTAADLTQNTAVTVVGQTGSDGTVNAQAIAIGAGGFAGTGRARPSPST